MWPWESYVTSQQNELIVTPLQKVLSSVRIKLPNKQKANKQCLAQREHLIIVCCSSSINNISLIKRHNVLYGLSLKKFQNFCHMESKILSNSPWLESRKQNLCSVSFLTSPQIVGGFPIPLLQHASSHLQARDTCGLDKWVKCTLFFSASTVSHHITLYY